MAGLLETMGAGLVFTGFGVAGFLAVGFAEYLETGEVAGQCQFSVEEEGDGSSDDA